ncbi:MAG: hypothetical protein ACK4NR_09425 [Micavibrio sp.]
MTGILPPPADWQPLPRHYRQWYTRPPTSYRMMPMRDMRFIPEVQELLDRGEIEVKFVIKNHRYPDPKNQYYWRVRQPELFSGMGK